MLMDWSVVHTDPGHGEGQPFSPPSDPGSPEAYLEWLRGVWRSNPGQRQRIGVLARMFRPGSTLIPEIVGPYATTAKEVIQRL